MKALAIAAFAVLLATVPAQATMHALVMGFDHYRFKVSLEGSRNDAIDLVSVLRRRGVGDIMQLDEKAGSRADIEAAWAGLAGRAVAGDLIFVSFSGHGNRSPEKGEPKHTPDGFDKGFLLPGYDEDKAPEEQLRFEHLYDLFKAVSDRDVKVVFVADACHAGGTVRAVKAPGIVPKFQTFQTHGQPLPPPPAPAAVVARPPIPNLTIFSAADETQTIQEFTIDGEKRGALSYVMARGLDGAAAEPDGQLTAGDLARYVLTNVRLRSENTQIPNAVTPDPDLPLFTGAPPPGIEAVPTLRPIAVFTEGHVPALVNATVAGSRGDAVLAWTGDRVFNAHGDAVASPVPANALQGAVDARRVLDALAGVVGESGRSLGTSVAAVHQAASDRYYGKGEQVRIAAAASPLPFLTVVDLTADGTVLFLWPRRGDALQWPSGDAPHFDVQVTPPFGQDTLIFIESDKALPDLHAALGALDSRVAPVPLYDALRLWLPQVQFRMGLQPVFTCAAVRSDGSCA